MRVVVTGGAGLGRSMSRTTAGRMAFLAAASLLAGCSAGAAPTYPAPPSAAVNVRRTGTEILFDVPGWRKSGAQVYLCPRPIVVDPDPERLRVVAGAAHCLDLGSGPAGMGIEGVGMPFESLSAADRAIFDAAPRWSVVIVESPTPAGHPPAWLQREVAGGPIAP
jgi:hypothetical protein